MVKREISMSYHIKTVLFAVLMALAITMFSYLVNGHWPSLILPASFGAFSYGFARRRKVGSR